MYKIGVRTERVFFLPTHSLVRLSTMRCSALLTFFINLGTFYLFGTQSNLRYARSVEWSKIMSCLVRLEISQLSLCYSLRLLKIFVHVEACFIAILPIFKFVCLSGFLHTYYLRKMFAFLGAVLDLIPS